MTEYTDPGEDEGGGRRKQPVPRDADTFDLFTDAESPSPQPTGRGRRDEALDEHEDHKREAVRWLRGELAQLFRLRSFHPSRPPSVSADDAREIYARSRFPSSYSQNRTFFGSVFRGRDWEAVGRIESAHPSNNARSICTYRYVGN